MIVETHDLTKSYRRLNALQDLNLAVEEGSAFALIGPNGAGKTTLLQLLMNLQQPSSGNAEVLGVDSRRISHRELARVGYVAENQVLPGRMTVGAYFNYLRPFYASWDRGVEDDIRARMQLPAERQIGKLSHGMRMKMALACAVPFKPSLLILDEPLSGLDPLARDELMEGVLHQAGDTTIVISSHELAEIEHAVTHVGYLDAGRMLFQESSADLQARVRQVRVVLDAPAVLPARIPDGWLDVRAEGQVLTFVDSHYSETTLGERVRSCVTGVRRIETESLSLRSIFVALARSRRGNRPSTTVQS